MSLLLVDMTHKWSLMLLILWNINNVFFSFLYKRESDFDSYKKVNFETDKFL